MDSLPTCPTERISKILTATIVLYFGTLLHAIVTHWQELSSIQDDLAGNADSDGFGLDTFFLSSTGSLSTLLAFAYGIVILFFVARLARATKQLGAEGLCFTPSRAVWGYIIPILSFYRPYLAMREAWQVCDPRSNETNWKDLDGYALVKIWWALGFASMAVAFCIGLRGASPISYLATDLESIRESLRFEISSNIIEAISAMIMLAMVRTISARMQAKWDLRFGPESVPVAKIENSS